MEYGKIYYREAQRDCYCRLCSKNIIKNTENIITFVTHRQNVILCLDCLKKINEMVEIVDKTSIYQ